MQYKAKAASATPSELLCTAGQSVSVMSHPGELPGDNFSKRIFTSFSLPRKWQLPHLELSSELLVASKRCPRAAGHSWQADFTCQPSAPCTPLSFGGSFSTEVRFCLSSCASLPSTAFLSCVYCEQPGPSAVCAELSDHPVCPSRVPQGKKSVQESSEAAGCEQHWQEKTEKTPKEGPACAEAWHLREAAPRCPSCHGPGHPPDLGTQEPEFELQEHQG